MIISTLPSSNQVFGPMHILPDHFAKKGLIHFFFCDVMLSERFWLLCLSKQVHVRSEMSK